MSTRYLVECDACKKQILETGTSWTIKISEGVNTRNHTEQQSTRHAYLNLCSSCFRSKIIKQLHTTIQWK